MPPLLLAGLLSLAILPALDAQQRGDSLASAVDAKGIRHLGSDYVGPAPWITADVVKKQRPRYPYDVRARQITGHGLFRVTLDINTGSVSKVTMVQSTRVATLDESAMEALSRWQWKPGKWKEIDIPITFTIRR